MYIARLPQVRPILSGLPSKSFLKINVQDPSSTMMAVPRGITLGGNEAPVLLDGWGNPIIYVPPGGIVVQIKGAARSLVGQELWHDALHADPRDRPSKSTDHPFWASAGPDGNFDNGDDNVYSFRQ